MPLLEWRSLRARLGFKRLALAVLLGLMAIERIEPLQDLARSAPARGIAPRLSITSEYRPCAPNLPAGGSILRADCPPVPSLGVSALARLSRRANARIETQADPEALRTVALIDLVWADSTKNVLDRAISYLQSAARLAVRRAPVLADLSAAHLVRAERTQNARDLFEALEAADEALELEPRNVVARFNLALALDRLGLDDQATAAWNAYLQVDSRSGWADEARDRMAQMEAAHLPAPPPSGASRAEVMGYAGRVPPQEMQLLGWDQLLGEWGDAVVKGDMAHAADRLGLVSALGEVVERRGGDATLADQVRAIRARSGNPAATRRLARAHQMYVDARRRYRAADYEGADTLLARVLTIAEPDIPLYLWAEVFYGATQAYRWGAKAGEPLLREAVQRADSIRHPALAGRARWSLGTTLLRLNRLHEAEAEYQLAVVLFARAGEPAHLGAVQNLHGVAKHRTGDVNAAYALLHRAFMNLRAYRDSPWLHGVLYQKAEIVGGDGLLRATERVLDEDTSVATRTGIPAYIAEARVTRGRLLALTGRAEQAARDIREGQRAVERMRPGLAKRWFGNDLREARAAAVVHTRPGDAVVLLDSAIQVWDSIGVPVRILPPLLARAEAHLAIGMDSAAEADLRYAVGLLDRQRRDIASTPVRAMLLDAKRAVFDRMVMLRVAAGRPDEALAYLERGRASIAVSGDARMPDAGERPRAPAGQVALDYALIGDTLLIWVIHGEEIGLVRDTVDRARLVREIERARSALELRTHERAVRPPLQALYELLVRPVEGRLGPPETPLLVVSDGEIAGVPFAALFDARRGRYLVEDRTVRFAATLRDAARMAPSGGATRGAKALLVADPAFDRETYPGLARLRETADQATAVVGAAYADTMVLRGSAANRRALLAALPDADVVHYVGHALFDDERPDRSVLVLAPERGVSGPGGLTAVEIESAAEDGKPWLSRTRLVVLAACQTLRSRSGRSGGFAGLAGAFLAAGAGGVVGSLWRVDDEATRPLMVHFHHAYRRLGDGAAALRQAQLRMLESSDPALRSPAAWAGFRYAGN